MVVLLVLLFDTKGKKVYSFPKLFVSLGFFWGLNYLVSNLLRISG